MADNNKYVSAQETRAQVTRDKLLEATINLVNQYGMKYLTVRNICEEAGLSTGSFYNLFSGKDELVAYYLKNVFTSYKAQAEAEAQAYSSLEKIVLIYRFYIQCVLETGLEFVTGLYATNTNPIFNFLERPSDSELVLDRVRDYIEEGKQKSEIKPNIETNDILLRIASIVTGIIYYWCVFAGRIDLAYHADSMLQDYLHLIAIDPEKPFAIDPIERSRNACLI